MQGEALSLCRPPSEKPAESHDAAGGAIKEKPQYPEDAGGDLQRVLSLKKRHLVPPPLRGRGVRLHHAEHTHSILLPPNKKTPPAGILLGGSFYWVKKVCYACSGRMLCMMQPVPAIGFSFLLLQSDNPLLFFFRTELNVDRLPSVLIKQKKKGEVLYPIAEKKRHRPQSYESLGAFSEGGLHPPRRG
jgi:hypothetical protein